MRCMSCMCGGEPGECSVSVCLRGCPPSEPLLGNFTWTLKQGTTTVASGSVTTPACVTIEGLTSGASYTFEYTFSSPTSTYWQNGSYGFTLTCGSTHDITPDIQAGVECYESPGDCSDVCPYNIPWPDSFTITDPVGNEITLDVGGDWVCQSYSASYAKTLHHCWDPFTDLCADYDYHSIPVRYKIERIINASPGICQLYYILIIEAPITCRQRCYPEPNLITQRNCEECPDYTPVPWPGNPDCFPVLCSPSGTWADTVNLYPPGDPPPCADLIVLAGGLTCSAFMSTSAPTCPGGTALPLRRGGIGAAIVPDCELEDPFTLDFTLDIPGTCLCRAPSTTITHTLRPFDAIWPDYDFSITPA